MKKMVLGKKISGGRPHPSNSPFENPLSRKTATKKTLTLSIPTHFISCLSSLKNSF